MSRGNESRLTSGENRRPERIVFAACRACSLRVCQKPRPRQRIANEIARTESAHFLGVTREISLSDTASVFYDMQLAILPGSTRWYLDISGRRFSEGRLDVTDNVRPQNREREQARDRTDVVQSPPFFEQHVGLGRFRSARLVQQLPIDRHYRK